MSGELKIVVSADLGEFGPVDGKPVTYNFNPIYHVQGFIPWLVFAMAFVVLKENRTARTALLLIPIAVLGLLYSIVKHMMRMDSGGSSVQLDFMFRVLVLGFSMIWLLAERIGNRSRLVTCLLAILIYLGFLGVDLLGGGFGKDTVAMACFAGASILAIFFALLLAGLIAGKPFNIARFLIGLPAALYTLVLILFLIVMRALTGNGDYPFSSMIVEALMASFFTALIYYVSLLPFVVLLVNSPFWRKRFDAVLGV